MTMAKKEMDKLSREVAQALACGMSYGKWKAKQEPVKIVKPEIPEGWKKCPGCGKVFKPVNGKQRYCDIGCRRESYHEKEKAIKRNYMRRFRENKKEGVAV